MSQHIYNKQSWKKSGRPLSVPRKIWETFRKTAIGKNLWLIFLFFVILGSLFALGLFALASRNLPSPSSLTERRVSQTTKIYDRTGEHLLYEIAGNENRTLKQFQSGFCEPNNTNLSLDPKGIPLYAVQATIAAEDRKFCEHGGFDVKGLARAVFLNLIGQRVGGSTLTQQLVKNAILSNEKTYTRKIKELILSIGLEQKYSKDEILQIYFNEIPYGSSYYGIEAASQNFFGKSVNELSVAEAATLAALPKAPTTYLNNPDMLQARRNYILGEMQKLGFIDKTTVDSAKSADTAVNIRLTNITAPHFVMDVKAKLEEDYGRRHVEEGGLRVITTLDYELQKIAEEEVKNGVEARSEQYGFSNASLVAQDPKTGQILALVGSKDFFDKTIDGQVNVSTRLRQPGSSFKPIVFAKAFEQGYTPNTVLWDVTTNFPTDVGQYTPNNYDLKERGPIMMRDALQMSLNIPAVKTVYLVGVEQTLDFATSLGYSSFSNHANFGLSIVLGGGEVKLVEHVNTYATFANDGKLHEQVSILRVEDANGSILSEWKQKDPKQVISENAAHMISNVLSDNNARVPVFGAKSSLQLGDRPVAAKSGTTNDYHDAWLMGYTPSLAAGVWVGNNNNKAMKNRADGSIVAGPIWNAFMKRAHEKTPNTAFPTPDIHPTGKPVLDGSLGAQTLIIDRASQKLATEFTPDTYKESRVYGGYHEILHFVIPSEPQGSIPEKPENDPHYAAWEAGLQTWLQKRQQETGIQLITTNPPTEQDDLHIPSNTPTIHIQSPINNTIINNYSLPVSLTASAPRGISHVEYYIDEYFIGSVRNGLFDTVLTIPNTIPKGIHSLKAVAYDDIDNSASDVVSIQIEAETQENILSLIDPKNGQIIEKTSGSYTVVTTLKNPQSISAVTIFAEQVGTQTKTIIGHFTDPTSPFVTTEWNIPSSGKWVLSATAQSKSIPEVFTTGGNVIEIRGSFSSVPSNTSEIFKPSHSLDPFTQ
jgi:penicillin-binding protein 1C